MLFSTQLNQFFFFMAFNISSCWKYLSSIFCWSIFQERCASSLLYHYVYGQAGAFSTQACQSRRFTQSLWVCCLLTIVIVFLLPRPPNCSSPAVSREAVLWDRSIKLMLLSAAAIIRSYCHWHILREKMIWVMLFLCPTLLCPVCHHLKTAKAVWKMTFPRGVKKSAELPICFLLCCLADLYLLSLACSPEGTELLTLQNEYRKLHFQP